MNNSVIIPDFSHSDDAFFNPDVLHEEEYEYPEEWFDLPAWTSIEGRYHVSNKGRVRGSGNHNIVSPFIKYRNHKSPSYVYKLATNYGVSISITRESLIFATFEQKLRAKGIDVPEFQKMLYADHVKKHYQINKKNKPFQRKSPELIREIRQLADSGKSYASISRQLQIDPETISRIAQRKTYKHIK